ncbi:unknown [Crocosphaera subtropica ATCC 51142]|uniref:Uncharacterized protein n=1 Tax=Crocosphaera subtropica (strain ATCC 51142 / BH68) TaxID=43989 RepID=B1WPX2_CROS5|nr:hypothetical protein [Crocosphaera subtropica]ACB53287.1 unknown [Crocosphaera subtropica ATCC 51142]
MTTESQVPKERAITPTDTEDTAITPEVVSEESSSTSSEIQQETTALIEAIRSKALTEAKEAGELARESYLDTVRRIRQDIEERKLFDPHRIDEAVKYIQKEVEKDWDSIVKEWNSVVKEVSSFGDRLNEAAKAAWEILTAPSKDKNS